MKKFFIPFLLVICLGSISSCIKGDENCVPKTIASETAQMQALAASQGMTASTHSSGILYEVVNAGSGMTASSTSKVFVRYVGKLPDGTVFDSQTDHTQTGWVLGGLISGWQLGIPLIQKGGKIRLVIPSSLAYGCASVGSIRSNSILYFEIELIDIQ